MNAPAPRATCPTCQRPASVCYCDRLPRLETATRLFVLQHPRERRVPVGTARILSLCLPSARLLIGLDFAEEPELKAALADPERPAGLLFPGPEAIDLEKSPPGRPITLIAVDGTWSQAKKLLRLNPAIAALPRYGLTPPPSEYRIRHGPRADYVSTLEAVAAALGVLEGEPAKFEALREPFRRMVDLQLDHAARLHGGRTRHRARKLARPGPLHLLAERGSDLVCAVMEANAWKAGLPGAHPDELVHLVACRVATGELFEAVLAPRRPLAPSTPFHTGLSEERLAAGEAPEDAAARWNAFLGPDDVLCTWGRFGLDLCEQIGARLPEERIDFRKLVGDVKRVSPGAIADCLAEWKLDSQPLAQGRAGERLGQLVALAAHGSCGLLR